MPRELIQAKEIAIIGPISPHLSSTQEQLPRICIDGGGDFYGSFLWIGDGDSAQNLRIHEKKVSLPKEKDISDLGAMFELWPKETVKTFHLFGFIGQRFDHELANIGEASRFLIKCPESQIIFYDQGKISREFFGKDIVHHHLEGNFSVLSLHETKISVTGDCKYQVENIQLAPLSSRGISNFSYGKIEIRSNYPYFIIKEKINET